MMIERVPWSPDDEPSIEGSIIIGRVKITDGATVYNAFEIDSPGGKTLAVWWNRERSCFVTKEITD